MSTAAEPAGGHDLATPATVQRGPHAETTEALAHLTDRQLMELLFEHVAAIYRTTVQLDEVATNLAAGGGGMFAKLLGLGSG